MIEPTVGRVVHYRRAGSDPSEQPLAAHVAFVHTPRQVNLMIIGHDGMPFHGAKVTLLQDDDPAPSAEEAPNGYAEWMPYQKGQAAKTEQLLAAAEKPQPAAAPAPDAPPNPPAPQAAEPQPPANPAPAAAPALDTQPPAAT